ncbi:hypothetical protein K6W16_14685 [Burkholderia dolosa]|uniref:Uncharacterized protein n=1 Tax=Burkholderia dolosa TaxID=152500 RepID=A0A892IGL4_9BURK|nr:MULTISPECIES: hypothetical protein [Burkholderia]MBR8302858.1 hypothetical protein [Burkholderia dolosa]MBR8420528.1 hypothetical protein [Burkholderia dolosa]MBY4658652.1 hypothetical protein [Burkholderia dolosa]MBY4688827.1 hypothetical protein [Burkholderia dolosa]MBY4781820.1 hypothetical protein [Burkholderia dolosa]
MNGCERFAVAVRGVRFVGGEFVGGAAAFAVRRLSDDHADAMRPIADAARVGARNWRLRAKGDEQRRRRRHVRRDAALSQHADRHVGSGAADDGFACRGRIAGAFAAHPHSVLRPCRKTAECARVVCEYAATALFDGD